MVKPTFTIKQIHWLIRKHKPKPIDNMCEKCNLETFYDIANISPKYNSETYNLDSNNWWWACRKCHMISDGRLEKLSLISIPFKKGHKFGFKVGNTIWVDRKHSDKSKNKMSEEGKKRIGEKNNFYGKTHTPETIQKIRQANIGKKLSEETKNKIRESSRNRIK